MSDEHFKLSNPAPLGLLGFGLTTVLLNLVNAGAFPLDTMVLAMGIAYGGIAQIIVGAMEYRKGNTFGTVAFTSYGLFWWSFVLLLLLPKFTGFAGSIRCLLVCVLYNVGNLHVRNVLRHTESQPCLTTRFRNLIYPVLYACCSSIR